jgi:uncharacterized membrane protein YdjX (TVP38/TMEM64 family)
MRLTITRRRVILGCVLGASVVAAALPSIRDVLAAFVVWAQCAGGLGVLGFALIHLLCALLLIPSWPLRLGAGFIYGPMWGFAIAALSSSAGATVAFVAGRRVLRERVARRIARDPRLAAIDEAVAANGLWIVFLLRLSPLFPNEVVNYGLSATRVRLRDYVLASFLGMIPLTAAYAWLGSLLTAVSDVVQGRGAVRGTLGQLILGVGLAASIAMAVASTRLARRALDGRLDDGTTRAAAPRTRRWIRRAAESRDPRALSDEGVAAP